MCPRKYAPGGYQCFPIRVRISHAASVAIVCEAFGIYHEGIGPSVSVKELINCKQISYSSKTRSGKVTIEATYAMEVPKGNDCHEAINREFAVKFKVTHPMRGFHNQGSKDNDTAPFTRYDSSNPKCYVDASATWGDESESDSVTLGRTVNGDPLDHLPVPDETYTLTITAGEGRGVDVRFEKD